jgi:hypothetical protein
MFHRCLHCPIRSARFGLQQLKLGILVTRYTSMTFDKWEWMIDHWLIKWTQHSLPGTQQPSTVLGQPWKPVSLGSCQGLIQEVEKNICEILATWLMWLYVYAKHNLVVTTLICILPWQRINPNNYTIVVAWFTEGSSQLEWAQWWHNRPSMQVAWWRLPWLHPGVAIWAAWPFI